ncbi:MAG: hypothetical protein ABMA02_03590 [Saprospiraceae bacterium]
MVQTLHLNRVEAGSSLPLGIGQSVRAEVVFGTPSKYCSGNGICMVSYRPLRLTDISCPHAPVRIRRVPGEGLVFLFAKEHLTNETLRPYFSGNLFVVEERFALPMQLVKAWQLTSSWVPPGVYGMEEYTREWRLFLPLPGDLMPAIEANSRSETHSSFIHQDGRCEPDHLPAKGNMRVASASKTEFSH